MKKVNLGFSILFLTALFLVNCKKEADVEPVQDSELQTAVDASYATFLVSDVEMICSFIGEDASVKPQFYKEGPISNGTVTVIRDISTNRVSITFNNTTCNDGRIRDGAIFMFFAEPQYLQHPATGNEKYIRDYNFTGRITLEEYKVDGWLVDDADFSAFIKNLRPNFQPPVVPPLKWTFEGRFKMKKNQDSMSWNGKFTKTLVNTSVTAVFPATAQLPIKWPLAIIDYVGNATGTTYNNVPFTYTIFPSNPLTRDFSCFPDPVSSVSLVPVPGSPTPSAQAKYSESHPFTKGVVSFTTGTSYQRIIYYGDESSTFGGPGNPDVTLPAQCDNKATVQIKGIYHPIDLKK